MSVSAIHFAVNYMPRKPAEVTMPTAMKLENFPFFGALMPNGRFQRFQETLYIPIEFDRDSGLWCAYEPSLGIDAYTELIVDLKSMIAEQLDGNFKVYALSPDQLLTEDAKELKGNLLRLVGR